MNRRYALGGALMLAASTLALNAARAQTAPPPPPAVEAAPEVAEVIVTANRRVENIQSAPLAVTALSGAQLQAKGLQSTLDLQQATPGLVFSDNANFSQPYVRGVGTDITTPGASSSVATYVDGVYQSSPYFGVQTLVGVERVEVLKGPQGALYGRNATGGAINIITRDPTPYFAADASVSVGNYASVNANAYVSMPFSDKIAANLAIAEDRTDGYGESINTGKKTYSLDRQYIHGKVLFTPSEELSVLLSGQFVSQYDTSSVYTYFTKFGVTPLAPLLGGHVTVNSWDIYSAFPFKDFTRSAQFSGKVTYRLGDVTITSLTAYTNMDGHIFPEFVGTDIPIFDFEADSDKDRTYSEDLTASADMGRLSWIVGFSYLNDRAQFDPDYTYGGPVRNSATFATVHTTSYAGFGEATFKLTNLISVIGGVRYTSDNTKQERLDFGDGAGVIFARSPQAEKTFDNATYKLVLQYTPEWGTAYAKYETGFKAGGVNALAPGDFIAPEELKSFELGLKTESFQRRLRLNGAAFYYDYANLQSQYVDVASGAAFYESAKKAKVYGAEIEAQAIVTDQLTVSAAVNLLHARFEDFLSHGSYQVVNGFAVAVPNVDLGGKHLTHAPPFTFSLGADWKAPLSNGGNITTTLQYYYSAKYFFDASNREYQSPFSTLNARVTWNLADGRTALGLWSRNLTDEKYIASASVTPFGDYGELAAPRTFGVMVSRKFN